MFRFSTITGSLLLFLALAMPLNAQVIEGVVLNDEGKSLQDAHIVVEKSGLAAITGKTGTFSLNLGEIFSDSVTFTISRVGYQTESYTVYLNNSDERFITIELKESVYTSEAVVVTATKTLKDIEEVSLPVSVITAEEIRQSGSMRLSDVLSEQTGMQIVNDHGTGIQVQGFDPDYTLIMIDGNPVIGRSAGTLDLTRISVRNVEQIEVVKGPSSALWGSEALAGVINIITTGNREKASGGLTTRYGENNTLDLSGDLSLGGKGFNNNFFVNRNSSGGYRLNPGSVSQTVPEFENYTLGYRGNVEITERLQFSGNLRWFNESQENRSSAISGDGQTVLLNSQDNRTDFMGRTEINYNPADMLDINLSLLTSYYGTDSQLTATDSGEFFSATSFNQFFNRPELQSGYRWSGKHHSLAGAGAIFERLDAERYPSQPSFTTKFLFAQHSWTPSPEFEVTGGLRYDTHSEYSSQFSPKISTRYRAADWIQFRASAGRGFKAPEFRQLFLDFTNSTAGYSVFGSSTVAEGIEKQLAEGTIDRILIPLENLNEIRAESSWALNGGFDLDPFQNIRLRVNLFRNNVSDLIETAPVARRTNGQSVFTYFNVDDVYTQGVETEFRIQFSQRLRGSIGYQLLDARRKIERERTVQNELGEVIQQTDISFEPMFNRSMHSGNFSLFFENGSGWGANLRGTLRGQFGLFDQNGNGFVDPNEYEPGYMVWNAAASREVGNTATIQIGADNILNYINVNQPHLAGRLWYGQLSIKF